MAERSASMSIGRAPEGLPAISMRVGERGESTLLASGTGSREKQGTHIEVVGVALSLTPVSAGGLGPARPVGTFARQILERADLALVARARVAGVGAVVDIGLLVLAVDQALLREGRGGRHGTVSYIRMVSSAISRGTKS